MRQACKEECPICKKYSCIYEFGQHVLPTRPSCTARPYFHVHEGWSKLLPSLTSVSATGAPIARALRWRSSSFYP